MLIKPATEQFGAYVLEARVESLSETEFQQVLSWWYKYAVLVFPAQNLSLAEQTDFTKRFGRLERGLKRNRGAGASFISNIDQEGNLVPETDIGRKFNIGNSVWHTDSSYKRVAAMASILSARVVPSFGGQTEWADMRQGYDALSDAMKNYLSNKTAVHSYRFSHAWHRGLDILSDEELKDLPPVEHPIVKFHPYSKRKVLFVGRHASHIVGEEFRSSRKLLRELTFNAAQLPRTWGHRWQAGDVAIWDNRCVLHRARAYPVDEGRSMVRTTVAGEDPTNEWADS